MNRREFLKKGLEGIILGVPLLYNCEKNPVKSELQDIFVEKNLVADGFGYSNGVVSKDELDKIEKHFISNTEAWGMGTFGNRYLSHPKNEIQLSEVIEAIRWGLKGPFKNEAELREYKEKLYTFRPAWLGIYVFDSGNYKSNQFYRLKYYFKASGDFDMQKGEFIPMIVKDDCKQINH